MSVKNILTKDIIETLSKSGVYMVFRVLAFLFTYLFAYLVIRFFGEDSYGFVTLAFTVLVIITTLSVWGFDINLTKIFAENDSIERHSSKYSTSSLISFVTACIFGILIYLNSAFISENVFDKPGLTPYLKWAAVTIPFWALILMTAAVFRGLKNILLFSVFMSFGRFFLACAVLLVLYFGMEQTRTTEGFPMAAHFLGLFVLFVLAQIIVFRKIKKPKISFDANFKKYFRSTLPILLSATLVILLTWIDKIFLGIYVDEAKIGVYDIAIRISMFIVFSLDAINSILTPKISTAYYNNNLQAMQKEIDFISKVNMALSLGVFVMILLFDQYIFGIFGSNFLMGQTALIIVAVGQLINSYTGPVWNIMQMTGYQALLSRILIVTLGINIVLNLILVKKYGINGAAWATAISLVFWNCVASYFIYKKLKIRTFYLPGR